MTESAPRSTALRICPLCEATCGLTLTIEDGRVVGAKGDHDDVFSAGYICPKGASFAELDNDPDRLTGPLVRRNGTLTTATWDEAFAAVAAGLSTVVKDHGGGSVGVYLGNPNAHTVAGALYPPLIIRGLGTHQVYSASTLDQMPKQVALGLMFGSPVAFGVLLRPPRRRTRLVRRIDPRHRRDTGRRRSRARRSPGVGEFLLEIHRHTLITGV